MPRRSAAIPKNFGYRPLLSTSFALDYWWAGGVDSRYFHVTQFLLLSLLGVGLFFFYRRVMDLAAPAWWNRHAALFAATFFCIHTANTETVNYLSSRSDVISTLAVVAAFLIYSARPGLGLYALIPVCLGALAKIPAVMFAPLLLMYKLLFEEKLSLKKTLSWSSRSQVQKAVIGTAPAFLVGALLFWFHGAMNPPSQDLGGGGRWEYLGTQAFVWLHYVRLFLLPVGLTADTDWTLLPHWYDSRLFAGLLLIGLLATIAWKTSQTRELRPVTFGICLVCRGPFADVQHFPLGRGHQRASNLLPLRGLGTGLGVGPCKSGPAAVREAPAVRGHLTADAAASPDRAAGRTCLRNLPTEQGLADGRNAVAGRSRKEPPKRPGLDELWIDSNAARALPESSATLPAGPTLQRRIIPSWRSTWGS